MWAGGGGAEGTWAQGEAGGQMEWTAGQGDGAGKGDGLVLGALYRDTSEAWDGNWGQGGASRPAWPYPPPGPARHMGLWASMRLCFFQAGSLGVFLC